MSVPWPTKDDAARQLELVWPRTRWRTVSRRLNELTKMADRALSEVLRNHEDRAIEDSREIEQRTALDELIGVLSLLEIGWLSGWSTPEQFPAPFLTLSRELLTREAALTFMTDHYPVRLPILALHRLHSADAHIEDIANDKEGDDRLNTGLLFELNRPRIVEYMNDRATWAFLDFMDDYTSGDYEFDDLLKDLSDLPKVIWCLGGRFGQRRPSGLSSEAPEAIRGLWAFLNFCAFISSTLKRLSTARRHTLASAYWHFFSYWIDEIYNEKKEFLRVIAKLDQVAEFGLSLLPKAEGTDLADLDRWRGDWARHIRELEAGLDFVRESRAGYRRPIEAIAKRLIRSDSWLRASSAPFARS